MQVPGVGMYEAYALDRFGDARSWSVTQVTHVCYVSYVSYSGDSSPPRRPCAIARWDSEHAWREGGSKWGVSLFAINIATETLGG